MNYKEHAMQEFRALGYKPIEECENGPNKWIQQNVFELLDVLDKQGHSGFSINYLINYFSKLALFKPLAPLTGEDFEWCSDDGEYKQNKRCSHVFLTNNIAYDIDGYVFWHWSERPLEEGEEGYPGIRRYKSRFTSMYSKKIVTFPYSPESIEVEVESYEVDENGNPCEGTGDWKTVYPQYIIENNEKLQKAIQEGKNN